MKTFNTTGCIIFNLDRLFILPKAASNDFTSNASVGTLKKSATGDCQPITVNGTFQVGNTLTNNSYVDVQLNVTTQGTFDIKTDTINGYIILHTRPVVLV